MPRRVRQHWLGRAAVSMAFLAVLAGSAAASTKPMEFQAGEVSSLVGRIKSSAQFKTAAAFKTDGRLILVNEAKYETEGGEHHEVAEITFYKYEGGVTLKVTQDMAAGQPPKVETLRSYPTPLAKEEEEKAVQLAREQIKAVGELLAGPAKDDLVTDILAPVVSNPKNPLYGHRLALLTFHRRSGQTMPIIVQVDLTRSHAKAVNP
jgi:hypothetical protein